MFNIKEDKQSERRQKDDICAYNIHLNWMSVIFQSTIFVPTFYP